MRIIRQAMAGTLESSDIFVTVTPAEQGVTVEIQSVVKAQFGKSIEQSIRDVLEQFQVEGVVVSVSDRGALDCTIRARVETALRRAI